MLALHRMCAASPAANLQAGTQLAAAVDGRLRPLASAWEAAGCPSLLHKTAAKHNFRTRDLQRPCELQRDGDSVHRLHLGIIAAKQGAAPSPCCHVTSPMNSGHEAGVCTCT